MQTSKPTISLSALGTSILILVLSGCSGLQTRLMYDGKPVTGVVLDTGLAIPANNAHTLFQYGRQVSGVNHFDPYCKFEINTVSEQVQAVTPDRFDIIALNYRRLDDDVTGTVSITSRRGCEDPVYFETMLRLRSPRQPTARALFCYNVGIHCSDGYYFLSAREMRGILGPSFRWIANEKSDNSESSRQSLNRSP